MKKLIFLSFAALLLVSTVHAENGYSACDYGASGSLNKADPSVSNPVNPRGLDTLTQYFERISGDGQIYSVVDPLTGYVFGTGYSENKCIFNALGMHYDGVDGAKVTEILAYCYPAVVTGDANTITGKVFLADASMNPTGDELGTGSSLTTADLNTTYLQFTSWKISNSESTNGEPFVIVLEIEGSMDDTFGIVANNADSGDGNGEFRARADDVSSGWGAVSDFFGGLDCDMMLFPVIDAPTEAGKPIHSKGLSIHKNYISSNNIGHVKYSINTPQALRIKVFSLSGRTILNTKEFKEAGEHELRIDFNNLPSGNYYYTIKSEKTSLTGRLIATN